MNIRKPRILWTDDEIDLLRAHIIFLQEKGYEVETANNGNDAVEKVKDNFYDIIFLDVRLPDMTGFETFERMKKIDPQATVIMMTGYAEEELIQSAVGAGAYAYLYKPFDMETVITLVETISRGK